MWACDPLVSDARKIVSATHHLNKDPHSRSMSMTSSWRILEDLLNVEENDNHDHSFSSSTSQCSRLGKEKSQGSPSASYSFGCLPAVPKHSTLGSIRGHLPRSLALQSCHFLRDSVQSSSLDLVSLLSPESSGSRLHNTGPWSWTCRAPTNVHTMMQQCARVSAFRGVQCQLATCRPSFPFCGIWVQYLRAAVSLKATYQCCHQSSRTAN